MFSPVHVHDCGRCVFLGTFIASGNTADLYFHEEPRTVIARWGSEGPDYTSGWELADLVPILHLARALAMERGLGGEPSSCSPFRCEGRPDA